jgi:hypothetical protein
MASLKLRAGTKKEVKNGFVEIKGQCVALYEITGKAGMEKSRLVFGQCLQPGESITKGEGDDYIVEF